MRFREGDMRLLPIPLLLGCVSLAVAADPPTITVVDISQGGNVLAADAINDAGDVVGYLEIPGGPHAVLLRDGGMIDLALAPEFVHSRALSINAAGQIVGYGRRANNAAHAFLWSREGEVLDIHPPSAAISWATAINDRGDVVVNSSEASSGLVVGLWKDGNLIPLGPGEGTAINRQGLVVGTSLWKHGKTTALAGQGRATAVNDFGEVVRFYTDFTLGELFLQRFPRNERTILPPLPGDTLAVAYGIDRQGRVVGASLFCEFECNTPQTRAVYWQDGVPVPLPPLLPYGYCLARGINDVGEIVGACANFCDASQCYFESRAVLWRIE